jgi:ribosomal protein L11 methyltransferase
MAFGTGHHETTRLASKGIIACKKELPAGFTMLDIGTGSGILCFIADCAGAAMTIGVDMDGVCLPNLAENRRKNKTTARLHFGIGTIDMFTKNNMIDLVVMNMISSEALPLLSQIAKLLKPKGFFVWSGLLLEEKDIITEKALQYGFVCIRDSHENEWWSGCFERT